MARRSPYPTRQAGDGVQFQDMEATHWGADTYGERVLAAPVDGTIEVVIAQSIGIAEVQTGSFDAEKKFISLCSETVGNASKVKKITRDFKVEEDELSYVIQMATRQTQLGPHQKALLKRT